MKGAIQIYGMLIVFTFMVFFIPQLLNFSMAYSRCNSIVMYAIDCVEGYSDVHDIDEINSIIQNHTSKYPNVSYQINEVKIDDSFYKYEIIVSNKVMIKLIGLDYKISSKKRSRRVSY